MAHRRTLTPIATKGRRATQEPTRVERDSLGSRLIPADAYWGISVSRALDNFPISGRPIAIDPNLLFAYACVKQAAARANSEIDAGLMERADVDVVMQPARLSGQDASAAPLSRVYTPVATSRALRE